MKRTLFLFAAMLVSVSVLAQTRTTFVSEHFDGTSMPAGWQITGSGTSNWSISSTQNAGGSANELHLAWSPQFNGTSRVVMPAVDMTGVTSVVVSFKHALDNYSGSHTLGIATSSDDGTTWNVAWQQSYNTSNSWTVTENITTADMGGSSVKFSLFYTGNSYNINDWFFDDIEIFSQENLDISLASIDMSSVTSAGSKDVAFSVSNKGITTVTQLTVAYQLDNEPVVEETFDVNMASLATTQLIFTEPLSLIPGSYNLTVAVRAVNGVADDDPSNDLMEKAIGVAMGETQRIPMIEHFSSSTCGPCVSVNTTMLNLTNNNPGKFTYTKYQMNWPGNGDPYYTNEGGVRRTYYNVSAVPQCFLDGQDQGYAAVTQATLDNHYNDPAFTEVRGSFNVSGNTITVKVDFMSYYDLNTAKAFVSVNEKETHNNVGGNGETSFHHVFMKFLTNPTGDDVNIEAGNYQHFEFTQDLSSTHVEEMSDLEVSAWLQEYGTKEMLNSHFMYEYTDIHPYPVQNLDVALNEGTLRATWDTPEGGNALSYDVYVNGVLAGNVTANDFSTTVTDEFNVVEVQALYADDMTSVKMAKTTMAATAALTLSATEMVFSAPEETQILTIANNTGADVTINEIAELETNYLYLEFSQDLPCVLPQGGSMVVAITPDNFVAKEAFDVVLNVVSTLGTQPVRITLDSSWYDGVEENGSRCEIYPNPTSGSFTVESQEVATVEVYNLVGQKVLEAQGQVVTIDASNWNKGIYMVNIKNQNGSVVTKKLMVE